MDVAHLRHLVPTVYVGTDRRVLDFKRLICNGFSRKCALSFLWSKIAFYKIWKEDRPRKFCFGENFFGAGFKMKRDLFHAPAEHLY